MRERTPGSPGVGHDFGKIAVLDPVSRLERPPAAILAPERERSLPAERQANQLGGVVGEALRGVGPLGSGLLPRSVRQQAEARLGVDLAGTRLDATPEGQGVAARLAADAVTTGQTISFAAGQLNTMTSPGRALLGHELTHVAQQQAHGRAAVQRQAATSTPPRRQLLAGAQRFLRQRAPADILAMVNRLNLTATGDQIVHTQKLGNAVHRFSVSLSWDRNSSRGEAIERRNTQPDLHTFLVRLGWRPIPQSAPETQNGPDGEPFPYFTLTSNSDRLSFLIAELLLHEFTHVQVLIGKRIERTAPGFADHSETFERYRKEIRRSEDANDWDLQEKRKDILQSVTRLGLAAHKRGIPVPVARLQDDTNKLLEFMIHERFAFRRAGESFGYTRREGLIADIYVGSFTERLLDTFVQDAVNRGQVSRRDASAKRQAVFRSSDWVGEVNTLTSLILQLYRITRRKPLDELRPGFSPAGSAAVPGRPLGIGGQPIR